MLQIICTTNESRKFNADKHKKVLFPQNYLNNKSNSEFKIPNFWIHFRMILIWQHQFSVFQYVYVYIVCIKYPGMHCIVHIVMNLVKLQQKTKSFTALVFFSLSLWIILFNDMQMKKFQLQNFSAFNSFFGFVFLFFLTVNMEV